MLSFFKKKSSEKEVAMEPIQVDQIEEIGEDALLRELGYRDASDLRETIYGEFDYI